MEQRLRPGDVYFLVLPGVHLLDLAGPAQILAHRALGKVNLHYIGPKAQHQAAQGLGICGLEPLPERLPNNAWVIVVGTVRNDYAYSDAPSKAAINWLRGLNQDLLLLACICSGALLAAKAGLFNQQSCTTHHSLIKHLQAIAPQARVLKNQIYVGQGRLWSSAGISTGIDLCLHLVSIYWSDPVAQRIARDLVLYRRRSGEEDQSSFWLSSRNHVDDRIHHVQDMILESPELAWTLNSVAYEVNVSTRHVARLFLSNTGFNTKQYVQCARIERARILLRETRDNIADIALTVGFGSERQFRRQWNKWNSLPPAQWRKY